MFGAYLEFVIWDLSFGLDHSDKGELSARPAFFSIRKEEIPMAVGTKIDAANLFFLNPFSLHLTDIDLGEVHHPLSNSS
jgi:hypothetical protein